MEQLIKHLQNIKVAIELMKVTGDITVMGESNLQIAIDDAITLAEKNNTKTDVGSCDCKENQCCYRCEFKKSGTNNLSHHE